MLPCLWDKAVHRVLGIDLRTKLTILERKGPPKAHKYFIEVILSNIVMFHFCYNPGGEPIWIPLGKSQQALFLVPFSTNSTISKQSFES